MRRRRTSLSFLNSVIVGIVTGTLVIGVRFAFFEFNNLRQEIQASNSLITKILWVVLTIGFALLIAFLLKHNSSSKQSGEDQVQAQLLGLSKPQPLNLIIAKIIGTLGSAFAGLPLGHGGPSMQIGAHVGKLMTTKANKDKEKTMMLSGQAAGFAGAFSAPLSGIIFNIELINRSFTFMMVLPALAASVIADLLARHVFNLPPILNISLTNSLPFSNYHYLVILAVLVGLLGVFFNVTLQKTTQWLHRLRMDPSIFIYISFGLSILLFFVFPSAQGPLLDFGTTGILALVILLVVRFIFSIISFQSNAMGGLFLVLMMIGGLFGQLFGTVMAHYGLIDAMYINNLIVFGMAAMISASMRAPLFAIVLMVELSNSSVLILPLAIAALVSTIVASQLSVLPFYANQLSQYAGIKPELRTVDRVVTEVYLSLDSDLDQKRIMDLKLPHGTLIISIYRYGKEINVDGQVRLQAGDLVSLVSREDQQHLITEMFH